MRFYICSTKYIHGKTCIHHYFLKSDNFQVCSCQQRTNPFDSRRNERNEKGNTQGSHRNGYSMLAVYFCHTRTMGNGLVAALAADAITLVAADLHKTKER